MVDTETQAILLEVQATATRHGPDLAIKVFGQLIGEAVARNQTWPVRPERGHVRSPRGCEQLQLSRHQHDRRAAHVPRNRVAQGSIPPASSLAPEKNATISSRRWARSLIARG